MMPAALDGHALLLACTVPVITTGLVVGRRTVPLTMAVLLKTISRDANVESGANAPTTIGLSICVAGCNASSEKLSIGIGCDCASANAALKVNVPEASVVAWKVRP